MPYVFFAFRIMVGLWLLMLMLVLAGGWLMWRRRLGEARWFHLACVCSSPLPFLAVLCGWTVTEVGRQPYKIVDGVPEGWLRGAENMAGRPLILIIEHEYLLANRARAGAYGGRLCR